jgi:hypothetical protein
MLIQAETDLLMQLFSRVKDLPRYLRGKLSESSPFRNVDPSDPPAPEPPWRSQKIQGLSSTAQSFFNVPHHRVRPEYLIYATADRKR